MRLSSVLRCAILAALAVSLAAAEQNPELLIKQVQDRYNGARTLRLQFTETFTLQGHGRPAQSGILTLKKQGKMRWDYTEPAGKVFLSDGKSVYLYTAADNRVEKIAVRDTEDMRAPLAFLLGHLDLRKEFRDFQVQAGDGGMWLRASAKSDRVPYDGVAMLVGENGSVRELRVAGRDGSAMAFTFRNEVVNPAVNESLFRFAIPPGAEVVDAVEFRAEGK